MNIEKEKEDIGGKIADMETENKQIKEESEQIKNENQQVKEESEQLKQKLQQLEAQITEMQNSNKFVKFSGDAEGQNIPLDISPRAADGNKSSKYVKGVPRVIVQKNGSKRKSHKNSNGSKNVDGKLSFIEDPIIEEEKQSERFTQDDVQGSAELIQNKKQRQDRETKARKDKINEKKGVEGDTNPVSHAPTDRDGNKSPMGMSERSRSPFNRSRSPFNRSRSSIGSRDRSKSPIGGNRERTKSPITNREDYMAAIQKQKEIQMQIEQEKEELNELVTEKEKVKADISQWLKEFEEKKGRMASNEDKKEIQHLYVEYKQIGEKINTQEEVVKDLNVQAEASEYGKCRTPKI